MDKHKDTRDSQGTKTKRFGKDQASSPSIDTSEQVTELQNVIKTIMVDIGFDISTSVIGICVLDSTTGDLVKLTHIDLKSSKFEDIYEKVKESRNIISEMLKVNPWAIKRIAVEEFAKQFSPGFSSADTLFTLAKFNHAICQFIYDNYDIKPTKVNVRSMRKLLGINIDYKDKSKSTKQKVFDMVKDKNPEFPWLTHIAKNGTHKGEEVFDKQNEDMADAWVVAKGNWKQHQQVSASNIVSSNILTVKPTKKKNKK